MKIDRLIAITMYLLNREIVSSSALAERFEVSKRTIQRDNEIRQQALEYLSGNTIEELENGDFIITMNVPFERMWFSLLMGFEINRSIAGNIFL